VLHIVSAGGAESVQQTLFMPLLTRMPKERVQAEIVCLSRGVLPAAVLRQHGAPVHEISLSRQRCSPAAYFEIVSAARRFRPDVIQAWGVTAQIVSSIVRARCDWKPRLVWSVVNTQPLPHGAGLIDRWKLRIAARCAPGVDRIVYTSETGAARHRHVGFPESGCLVAPPGLDAARFKPDAELRRKVREQLQLSPQSFVIGMHAPFRPDHDHATFLKAMAELVKTHPEINVVLAGRGVQKGNAQLMALLGGGSLGARVHLLGEWSDVASLFNACDMVCSSALDDSARMTLAMAMLCGVPCVATGMGAQGELIGSYGVALEPGSPAAFVKGVTRVMQLPPERRAQLVQGARKHAMKDYVYVRSLQKYLQLYFDLLGESRQAADALPAPPADAAVAQLQAPKPVAKEAQAHSRDAAPQASGERAPAESSSPPRSNPDVIEPDFDIAPVSKGPATLDAGREHAAESTTTGDGSERAVLRSGDDAAPQGAGKPIGDGDVLELFELSIASSGEHRGPALQPRTVDDAELEDLLAPEELTSEERIVKPVSAPAPAKPSPQPREDRMTATQRMRAVAREELKRAAAALAGKKSTGSRSAESRKKAAG